MPDNEDFNRELAAAAREMQDEDGSRQAMERAVAIATKILPGCDAAGVCVVYPGQRVDTHATSDDVLRQVDSLQHELQEGPCLDALRLQDTVQSSDLSTDERWPRWGPEVVRRLGLFSIVSYRLFSTGDNLGALNLYGKGKAAFTTDDVHDGMALAAHVGVALAGAQEVENLEKALAGRTVIGQATGMLMERFDLSPDRAFGVLSRLSQHRNLKLRQLAEQIVHTREVPKG
ncbi:GAF domain-containing protein [Pedococcus cremeus]|uniref:GAF domain-containing protein n=1 Tax=Pedococcus cremeus TaxID=587636 RepID=A0A1H9TFJ2_9MICO|nr:GAF and ANTAR domain-containing protein [Pedococcus cremeus]SER95911.1 GAF domain-containing protein [Pedococcus cremeus]